MRKINLAFYAIISGCALLLFITCSLLSLHKSVVDYKLFHWVSHFNTVKIEHLNGSSWTPFYILVLGILFFVYRTKYFKVLLGLVAVMYLTFFFMDFSVRNGLVNFVPISGNGFTNEEIKTLQQLSHTSCLNIALAFSAMIYVFILMTEAFMWIKRGFLFTVVILAYLSVYSGSILPFCALTACFAGIFVGSLLAPIYIRRVFGQDEDTGSLSGNTDAPRNSKEP